MIKVLLVFNDEDLVKKCSEIIRGYYGVSYYELTRLHTLQEAIETFELKPVFFDLVIFDQRTASTTLSKVMIPLIKGAKFMACIHPGLSSDSEFQSEYIVEKLRVTELEEQIVITLKKFEMMGYLVPVTQMKDEFISIKPQLIEAMMPVNTDVFIKMQDGRFVRIFKEGDQLQHADFQKFTTEKSVDTFYLKKTDYDKFLSHAKSKLDALATSETATPNEMQNAAIQSVGMVSDIIRQLGFTPQAQAVAKSSVAMTAKMIGTNPRFNKIIKEIRKKDGNYLSSHSIAIGTLACAIAYKLEWQSSSTFFKLSLSAFLHDITLTDQLAKMNDLSRISKSDLSDEESMKVRLHSIHAADYARMMPEIPSDVSQIILQHHELPDGSGFPRGLTTKHIAPLSSVFIFAHELMDFCRLREHEPLKTFFTEKEELFRYGNFRKIWLALQQDLKAD